MTLVRVVARPLLAGIFIASGVEVLRHPEEPAERAAPVIDKLSAGIPAVPSDPVTAVRLNAAVQLVAGLGLATGKFPRLSALTLAGSLVATTAGGHRFWEHDDPAQRRQQLTHAMKNAAILGGLLYAATDRKGRGLGRQARRSAKDARRTAKALVAAGLAEGKAAVAPVAATGKVAAKAGRAAGKTGRAAGGKTGRTAGKTGRAARKAAGRTAGRTGKAAVKAVRAAA
jgi:putative oxidoreductase